MRQTSRRDDIRRGRKTWRYCGVAQYVACGPGRVSSCKLQNSSTSFCFPTAAQQIARSVLPWIVVPETHFSFSSIYVCFSFFHLFISFLHLFVGFLNKVIMEQPERFWIDSDLTPTRDVELSQMMKWENDQMCDMILFISLIIQTIQPSGRSCN
jgi:hypothetical protein